MTTVPAAESNALYDFGGDGLADDTSWIGMTEGLLFLDHDKNSTVTLEAFAHLPAFGAAQDLMGADLDTTRELARLRQSMAGFGGSGLTNRGQQSLQIAAYTDPPRP